MTSGATYWGVPQIVIIWLSAIFLARPKSAIFTAGTSFSVAGRCSSRFSSLRSLWLILLHSTYAQVVRCQACAIVLSLHAVCLPSISHFHLLHSLSCRQLNTQISVQPYCLCMQDAPGPFTSSSEGLNKEVYAASLAYPGMRLRRGQVTA